ncbi:hypothetical protein LGQ02_16205 [Bacillus shivajii]|uniref:CBO0543 family protein n=1 Tax=Bacillus shivajii TaxID=1983719 RepID=UPI001CFB9BA4|nr:CBO0543 family protein [Bacillus shivajii]UCZ52372.1 hypothetical protein LGQ02_16205 [Bacillus shivajii]
MGRDDKWNDIIDLRIQLWEKIYSYWVEETLFTFNWWLLLTTAIGIFIVWFILLNKKIIIEIIAFGLLISTFAFILDLIGITMVLWSYPDRILPLLQPTLEIHKLHMPIIYMLIYQYFRSWIPFIIVITITSFVFSFVLEPLLEWLNIYEAYHWHHIYSFPIYIALAIIFKWTIEKLKNVEKRHRENDHYS